MDLFDWLTKYWALLATVVAIIVSWVRYEGKNNDQDKDIENQRKEISELRMEIREVKSKQESNDKVVTKLEVTLGKIETSLEFILKKLDK